MKKYLLLFILIFLGKLGFCQFIIFGNPTQSNISNNSFTVGFITNTSAQTLVRYGLTPALELGYSANGQNTTNHSISLNALAAASFYYVRPCVFNGTDTVQSTKTYYYSTASNSTGEIKVFFNRSVDTDVSTGTYPNISNAPAAIQAELIRRIDSAKSKIDCSIYNNNTTAIVTALNNAHNRGVRVRYVANDGTANTALSSAQFPVIYVNPIDLMHNKFMITDPDSIISSYVWTGSMNWTSNNINDDYNNVVLIQDQALAKAYVIEFEEMWGSDGSSPNALLSKSGSQKSDNTPHFFNIGGKLIECYFSPSDKTTEQIERAVLSAGGDLQFALLTLTRDELSNAIISKFQSGETVAGIIENIGDQGSDFTALVNAGVDVMAHTQQHDIHHKYAIIDANTPTSDPMVVTGSHNWSTNAETVNDENTLIIHDAEIANWFLQEFAQRYCELKATTGCSYNPPIATEKTELAKFKVQIFPNPATDVVNVQIDQEFDDEITVSIISQYGQLLSQVQTMNQHVTFNSAALPVGTYFISITTKNRVQTERFTILR